MKASCIQKLILTIFLKSEFLHWNRSEFAPGTPLVGFSRSDSEGFVYSTIYLYLFSKVSFTVESLGISSGTALVGFSRSDSEGFVYSKIDVETFLSKVRFTLGSPGISPRAPLGWIQQVR